MKTATSAPNFNYGFPTPGPQEPTGSRVMDHVFFLSEEEWKSVREQEQFDYVIVGTGFCALGFIERIYEREPHARILVLERGTFFLPEHFQNLPLPFQQTLGGLSETFPWTLSARTVRGRFIRWQHGMVPFFGGRSTLWSAWCPRPTREEMEGWPSAVIDRAHEYFESAEKILNVVSAGDLDHGQTAPPAGVRPVFGVLQERLTAAVESGLSKIPNATRAFAAPLAVGAPTLQGVDFDKFSTPGPLLGVVVRQRARAAEGKGTRLSIATNCIVLRALQQDGRATALETTRGVINLGDAHLILAMGTLPPTTLVLNSFPQVKAAGTRFTAHFISSVVARVRRTDFPFASEIGDLELAAIYLAGMEPMTRGQYHVQLTALSDRNPSIHAETAARHMPDVVATASAEQLRTSPDHVVFVCAVLGELDFRNADNWLHRTSDGDPTANVMLQVTENANDLAVWDAMDNGTFDLLEKVLSPLGAGRVEYWIDENDDHAAGWRAERPGTLQIRVPALVHEGSTLYLGEEEDAPVGLDYRLRGVENVFVTGASIWPRGASWNPTMTMVGLAQHLADTLAARGAAPPITGQSLESTHTHSALT